MSKFIRDTQFGVLLLLLTAITALAAMPGAPSLPRVDYCTNPLGITNTTPVFSWVMNDPDRGEKQTAYQLVMASSPQELARNEGDVWDTGWVKSGEQTGIRYAGKPLQSRTIYYWKVRLRDKDGQASPFSNPATVETGLLTPADWRATWIYTDDGLPKPVVTDSLTNLRASVHPLYNDKNWSGNTWRTLVAGKLLRRAFTLPTKSIRKARVYVANLGYYELRLNGRKVGDHVLDPGMTDCSQRVLSVTHDVTSLLTTEENAVGVMLSTGRMLDCKDGFLFRLDVDFTDNTHYMLLSDNTWKGTLDAPFRAVVSWGLSKERYDATREQTGWDRAGFADTAWQPVRTKTRSWQIDAQLEPIRVIETIKPVSVRRVSDSSFVFDMGQNFSGWARLRVRGPRGTAVTLQYSEHQRNAMSYNQTDQYILAGNGQETWEPRFTYHGFQWVTVINYPGEPTLESIEGVVVHSDVKGIGTFTCSNPLLNRLYQNNRWSLRTNLHSVYTDSPSREKVPWLGQWSQENLSQNFDMGPFFLKWKADLKAAQRQNGRIADKLSGRLHYGWNGTDPVWVSEAVLGTWDVYRAYGDKQQLADSYPVLQKLMAYYQSITDSTGLITQSRWGDHLSLDKPSPVFLSTSYYFQMAQTMALLANELGRDVDAIQYRKLAEKIRADIDRAFFTGVGYDNNSQAANAVALHFGLPQPAQVGAVLATLEAAIAKTDYHVSTGGASTYNLMNALWNHNKTALAYRMAGQKTYPGWGYWVANGATTSWEQWPEDKSVGGSSKNHGWLGSYLGAWLVKAVGGISILEPGYRKIKLVPGVVGDLTSARSSVETVRGTVTFGWDKSPDGTLTMLVTVPPNSSALLYIPLNDSPKTTVSADNAVIWQRGQPGRTGNGIRFHSRTDAFLVWEVGSGSYRFVTGPASP